MTENASTSGTVHRWYTRPVLFVGDVNRAVRFYVEKLGFEKGWHEGEGAGTVCQVNRRDLIACSVPTKETWWGYDTLQVDDPDGNELLFPRPD